MPSQPRAGRPRASSRETLADAACELFLEQGFEATSIADIAARAGVSRSSFFNYFSSKGDIVWGAFDERLDAAAAALSEDGRPTRDILAGMSHGFAPDSLALAIANSDTMGLTEELQRERALRQALLARAVADRLMREGIDPLGADVGGSALAGAVLAAVWRWANDGAGSSDLGAVLEHALDAVRGAGEAPGGVRQLRVVVHAAHFEAALAFYRDDLGMPQREAFEADGGARVVILDAGRATLELANSAQVAFIDRIETDGGASDPIRIAFEVSDTAAVAARLVEAGAGLEASTRETPWRSLNARLRAPADLQVTLFHELGPE